ncbi:MAG: LysR family transcriptional regulator [Bdellovibrionota bacterium]
MINKVINFDPNLIRLLPTIVAVAESKNFKDAASKLKISQPAITQQMRTLENALDIPLMKTVGKKKILTPFGNEVYLSAKQHLNQLMASMGMVQNKFSDPTQRVLRIGARAEILEFILPQLSFPGKFHCAMLSAAEASKKILEGELDLAVTHERPESSELFSKVAFESRPVFAVHKNLLKKTKGKPTSDFFKNVPHLIYRKDAHFLEVMLQSFDFNAKTLDYKVLCEDWGVIRSLIVAQQGFSIVPVYVSSTFPADIETIELPKKELKNFTYYFLFRRENKTEILELIKAYHAKLSVSN